MDLLKPTPLEECAAGCVSWCNASRVAELETLPAKCWVYVPMGTNVRTKANLVECADPKGAFFDMIREKGYMIFPGDEIEYGKNLNIGDHCSIGGEGFGFHKGKRLPHIGKVIIGDDVEIGSNVCIDRGTLGNTVIGNRVKMGHLVHIAHNVKIGDDTIIIDRVGVAGSAVIGKGCYIGYGATILKVKIGDGAIIGAHACVTKDVPAGETWAGVPAKPLIIR